MEHLEPRAGAPTCPYCRASIADDLWTCGACRTPHHQGCAQENGRCTVFGCDGAVPARVVVPAVVVAKPPAATCPHCHAAADREIWVCRRCFTIQHHKCAEVAKKCGHHGCKERVVPSDRPEIRFLSGDTGF